MLIIAIILPRSPTTSCDMRSPGPTCLLLTTIAETRRRTWENKTEGEDEPGRKDELTRTIPTYDTRIDEPTRMDVRVISERIHIPHAHFWGHTTEKGHTREHSYGHGIDRWVEVARPIWDSRRSDEDKVGKVNFVIHRDWPTTKWEM